STGDHEHYVSKIRRYVAGWLVAPVPQEIELRIFYRVRDRTNEEIMQAKRAFAMDFVASLGLDAAGYWDASEWQPEFLHHNPAGKPLRIRFIQTTEGGLYPSISNARHPGDVPPD